MSLGTEALWRSALFQEIMPAIGMPPLRLLEALKPRPAPNPLATLARDHPDPRSPGLPTNLSEIFANLEVIRTALRRHQTFVLSSYAMLADDRLLDDPKYSTAFAYWQESYPGVRLSDIATLNAYQNALFRNYAKLRGLPFLELADALVAHPDLFEDGIHLNAAGKKLQGWLAFLQILPLIRSQLDAGILPHSEEAIPVRHPYLEDEAVLVDARHASN
jgi:hypothetical protein